MHVFLFQNVSSVMKELSVGSVSVPCHDSSHQTPPISPRQPTTPPHSNYTCSSVNGPQSISLGCDNFRQHIYNTGRNAFR